MDHIVNVSRTFYVSLSSSSHSVISYERIIELFFYGFTLCNNECFKNI